MLRWVRLAIALGLVAGGVVGGLGAPRLTLVNTGLRMEYPWGQGLALLGAAVGVLLLGWSFPRTWMRSIAGVASLLATAVGAGRATYRLDATEAAIADRRLFGSTRVAWGEVQRVDAGAALVLVWGPGDSQVRVETSGLTPDQRAVLDRTISRHVREAQEKARQAPTRPANGSR